MRLHAPTHAQWCAMGDLVDKLVAVLAVAAIVLIVVGCGVLAGFAVHAAIVGVSP